MSTPTLRTLAADTAAMIRFLAASGRTGLMQASIDSAEQALDDLVGRGEATVDVDGADHGFHHIT